MEGHFTVGKWPGKRKGRAGGGSLMRTWLKRLLVGPRLEQGREVNQKELLLRVSQLRQAVGEPTRTQGEGAWGEPGKSKSRTKETTAADSPWLSLPQEPPQPQPGSRNPTQSPVARPYPTHQRSQGIRAQRSLSFPGTTQPLQLTLQFHFLLE